MIDADLLRLRVLLYFYKAEENGPTVTECAKSFQTEKIISVAPKSKNRTNAASVPPASPITILFGTQFL